MSSVDQDARIEDLEGQVARLLDMLGSAPDTVMRVSVDGRLLFLNHVAPGFTMDQVIGTSMLDFVPPAYRERVQTALRLAAATGQVQSYEIMGPRSADSMGHYLSRVSPIIENGEVTSLLVVATDVTELQESRTRLQLILDATKMGIWSFEPAAESGTLDETTRSIFGVDGDSPGIPMAEMLGQRVHAEDRDRVGGQLQRAMLTGKYEPIEHRVVHPDGTVRWVAASGVAVRDEDGQVSQLVGGVRDITERRALEARLLEAEKLESIGRLAGGIAHDFNNMLTTILGNLEVARGVGSDEGLDQILDDVRMAAERSAALTAQLLAFARRQVIEPRVVDPNALIRRVDRLVERVLGEDIVVDVALEALGAVKVDASQFEQVVMNLVTNARDAMAAGGRLTLRTADVAVGEAEAARIPGATAGPYVRIAVGDTGPGISPDDLPHVFEPFYSTRSHGTGLGLATCYGIVQQNKGHIHVRSELEVGTTFEVFLPRVEPVSDPGSEPAAMVPAKDGGESVLVVEDEPLVAGVLRRSLERAGYHVTAAERPDEALALARARSEPFDLLVTDLVMPGIGGRELAERLTTMWPSLLVLLISGYTDTAFASDGVLDRGVHFLQKPFLPSELLAAVRRVLDQRTDR